MSVSTTISKESGEATRSGQRAKTFSYYAANITLGLLASSLGPTLPGLAAQTQTDLSSVSLLFTARALGGLLGSSQMGRLYDRLPGHPVMAVVLLLVAGMMAVVPFVPWLWVLAAWLLVMGIFEGTLHVGGNTLTMWVHQREAGPFITALHFFFGLGAFLSPIIIAQAVLLSGGIAWAYWALALILLPVAGWLLALPSPPIRRESDEEDPARKADYLLVLLVAVFFFLYVGAEVGFGGWIFSYAVTLELSGETVAAYLTSTFWGALTLGRLLAIPLAKRLRPRTILLLDLLGSLLSVAVIWLWSDSLIVVWLATFGLGLSMASIFPTTLNLAERRMAITGQITGWFFVGASAGAMSLPWLLGRLFGAFGPPIIMVAILVDLLVAVTVFTVLIRYSTRPVTSTE